MIKLIKRTTDKKFLQSVETDTWVEDMKEAFKMTYRECELVKTELFKIYPTEQIVEVVDMSKSKPITKEEKQDLINLLIR